MSEDQGEKGRVVWEIHKADKTAPSHYAIFCPACKCLHVFDERWTFNGDFDKPTFKASMLVHENADYRKRSNNRYGHRCHSHVTDGKIQFLGDCTHDMKNQTVDLKPY